MGDEKLELSPELAAEGWEIFEVEGPIYGDDGSIVVPSAVMRGFRKTFKIPLPPAGPDGKASR